MKHVAIMIVVAYAVVLGAPRNQRDWAAVALTASVILAEIGVALLDSPRSGYDAGANDGSNHNATEA